MDIPIMRNNSIFIKTILLSIVVHIIAFIQWDYKFSNDNNQPKSTNEKIIRIALNKQPIKKQYNRYEHKKIINKTKKISNTPILTSSNNLHKIKDNTRIKKHDKTTKNKKRTLDMHNNKPMINKKKITEDKLNTDDILINNNKKLNKKTSSIANDSLLKQKSIDIHGINKNYIKQLLTHIEEYKFYPRAARRRAIEGILDIGFYLHSTGSYYKLTITGGRSILQSAARQALNDALPFPKPPDTFNLDTLITFNLHYQLKY